MSSHRVFVYGTLLRGGRNHHLMSSSRLLRETATSPGFRLLQLDDDLPGMVQGGRGSVAGELYEVDEETLARLDELEQHPDIYWRTAIRLVDGSTALAYIWRDPASPMTGGSGSRRVVTSGDWRRRER